jgi:hypothetical protein
MISTLTIQHYLTDTGAVWEARHFHPQVESNAKTIKDTKIYQQDTQVHKKH